MSPALQRLALCGLCSCTLVLGSIGCDSADNPVAPTGTVLTVSANPSTVGPGQTSTITVTGIRPDGNPAAGASVTVRANIGSLSESSLTLDPQGRATTVFTAPDEPGTATITVAGSGGITRTEIEVTSDEGQVALDQESVELEHSRSGSDCDDPIEPKVGVSNNGNDPIDFRIVDDLPAWLTTDVTTGPVPGEFQAIFTCMVGEGDLDLSHDVRVQGIDSMTMADVGDEATVTVVVHVRD